MKRLSSQISTLAIALAIGTFSGCYSCWDHFDSCTMGLRDHFAAKRAWSNASDCYDDHAYRKDFGRGFQQGYRDVSAGQNGCPPAVPPRNYWGVKYQSAEGRARIEAWFEGYSYGALAASQDGVAQWNELVVKLPDSCQDTASYAEYSGPVPEHGLPMPEAAPPVEVAPPVIEQPEAPTTRIPDLFVPEILPPVELKGSAGFEPTSPAVDSLKRDSRAKPMPVEFDTEFFPSDTPSVAPQSALPAKPASTVQPAQMQSIKSMINRDGTLVHERNSTGAWRPTIDIKPRVSP